MFGTSCKSLPLFGHSESRVVSMSHHQVKLMNVKELSMSKDKTVDSLCSLVQKVASLVTKQGSCAICLCTLI